jgi:hypothetical protein
VLLDVIDSIAQTISQAIDPVKFLNDLVTQFIDVFANKQNFDDIQVPNPLKTYIDFSFKIIHVSCKNEIKILQETKTFPSEGYFQWGLRYKLLQTPIPPGQRLAYELPVFWYMYGTLPTRTESGSQQPYYHDTEVTPEARLYNSYFACVKVRVREVCVDFHKVGPNDPPGTMSSLYMEHAILTAPGAIKGALTAGDVIHLGDCIADLDRCITQKSSSYDGVRLRRRPSHSLWLGLAPRLTN